MKQLKGIIKEKFKKAKDKIEFINDIKSCLFELSPQKINPVDRVLWVKSNKVVANEYNPNKVEKRELDLLHLSIKNDGYTQPIVTIYDKEKGKYVIVDGFHRYYIEKRYSDISKTNEGYLPIVVLEKDANDRMASTIRHNRARGKHEIKGMSKVIFDMLENGWTDADICKELGMESDELVRLKHITGFSKLFENVDYKKAWQTRKQLRLRKKYQDEKETP